MATCARFSALISTFAVLLVTASVHATTYTVDPDGPYPTIQSGLDVAVSGDTVAVVLGTYTGPGNRDLNFGGNDVILLSLAGAGATIIDAEDAGGGFSFFSGESAAAVVDGFTITNASVGSPLRFVANSSPTIRNCVIRGNYVSSNPGGAAFIQDSSPTFIDCLIVENSNTLHAGGVFVNVGKPSFTGCTFVGNTTLGRGGAFWLDACDTVSIHECTISGNRADGSGSGFEGGALLLTNGAKAALTNSIVWCNLADTADEILVAAGAYLSIDCSDVDILGIDGSVVYGPDVISEDPQFCQPACCRGLSWTHGEYTLADTSPCLPGGNDCGQHMGSQAEGCTDVVVWTGLGGDTDWDNDANWSGNTKPGPGDHVQINRGTVVLVSLAEMCNFTHCPRWGDADTLFVLTGGILDVGFGGAKDATKKLEEAATSSGTGRCEGGTLSASGPDEDCEGDWLVTEEGTFDWTRARIKGNHGFRNRGRIAVTGPDTTTVEIPLQSNGAGGEFQHERGLHVLSGVLAAESSLTNLGETTVAAGAEIMLTGTLDNQDGGVFDLAGDLLGTGQSTNRGDFNKTGSGTSEISTAFDNTRSVAEGYVGTLRVTDGTLHVSGPFTNTGLVVVAEGAILQIDDLFDNLVPGLVVLAGDITGSGTVDNLGTLNRTGVGTSSIAPGLDNLLDTGTGHHGRVHVLSGTLNLESVDNWGYLTVTPGATLAVGGDLTNEDQGWLTGDGTYDLTGGSAALFGVISPGTSPGILAYAGDFNMKAGGRLFAEIGGTVPGDDYDRLDVTGTVTYGGALHVRLINGFIPSIGDTFELITATEASLSKHDWPGFDCYSGLQIEPGLTLEPLMWPRRFVLVAEDTTPANDPPVAEIDFASTPWSVPINIFPLANDDDVDDLSIVYLSTANTRGTAFIAEGQTSITYVPPVSFVGVDTLVYAVGDCEGGIDSSFVYIAVADISGADPDTGVPPAAHLYPVYPNPFNPVARIRFDLPKPGDAQLAIYDLRGRRIAVLAEGHHPAGRYVIDWWGRDDHGRQMSSGVYFVRLVAGSRVETRKVSLVR